MNLKEIRALHILHTSLPNLSGYSVRASHILRFLATAGVELRAVTSAQQEPAPAEPVENIEGLEVWRTAPPGGPRVPGLREARLMQALYRRAAQAAADFRPDLVHAHSPVLCGLPALRLARRLHIPLAYEVRDFWENASVDVGKFAYDSVPYRVAKGLDTRVMRGAQAVVVLSRAQREAVLARGVPAEAVVLAPNGVDVEGLQPDPALAAELCAGWGLGGRKVLLYLGAFLPYEGLEVLVTAMRLLVQAEPEALLLFVGDGDLRPRLEALAAEQGVAGNVRFAGRVPRAQVAACYGLARAAVYPRLRTRTTEVTTPLKPLEAMALGVPVVATDLPALREIVCHGETGLLARPGDAQDLADKCLCALRDEAGARRRAQAAREQVAAERDWAMTLSPYLDLYERLVEGPD